MTPPPLFAPDADWRLQLRARVATLWHVKALANTLGLPAFFVAYFWVLHHPQFPVVVMPLTALDHWVTFEPAALPLYGSLWVYVSLPLALLKNRHELACFGLAALALSAIGLGIFLVCPTTVPVFAIDWSQHSSIAFLKRVDVGDNACPSLHVAFAVFTMMILERLLREMNVGMPVRWLNAAWCLAILYSTLATRQHVALDVLAGSALGAFGAALLLRAMPALERCPPAPALPPAQTSPPVEAIEAVGPAR